MITSRDRKFLIDQAIEAIREALWDGRKHPEDWRTVSIEDHVDHMQEHLTAVGMAEISLDGPISQEDLRGIICRAAMIRAKLKLENEPNQGDE